MLNDLKFYFVDDSAQNLIDQLIGKIEDLPIVEDEKKSLKGPAFDVCIMPPELEKFSDDYLAVFTDGACRINPGPGAWATLVQNKKGEILIEASGLDLVTTNNKMELEGVIQGLGLVYEKEIGRKVVLFSDSRYVIDGMSKWLNGWKSKSWKKADGKTIENLDLWQKLDLLMLKFDVIEYVWVKGHAGHPQNEYCDWQCNQILNDAGL